MILLEVLNVAVSKANSVTGVFNGMTLRRGGARNFLSLSPFPVRLNLIEK